MRALPAGLYELLVTEALKAQLEEIASVVPTVVKDLEAPEASDRIAWHLSRQIRRALEGVPEQERVRLGVAVAKKLLEQLAASLSADTGVDLAEAPTAEGKVLRKILETLPDGSAADVAEPLTPLLDTTVLTNSPGEPNLWSQLRSEIDSADRIDVVMAFIRRSGVTPLLDAIRRHCLRGRPFRVLTTTYTGATESEALQMLTDVGADVRVSYDTSTTRLHAKAWLFHRESGFSTAYVGSSNLTHAAQTVGVEWNVRISAARNPDAWEKLVAVFDAYWESGEYVPFDADVFEEAQALAEGQLPTAKLVRLDLSPLEVRPYPFQERLLEQLEVSRRQGHHRNLLVAATGTGKTVMAALDYARLRRRLPRARLLFVAHREEILDQSLATFRHVLRDPDFGEKWVGGVRPRRFEHVFASIQSLHAAGVASPRRDTVRDGRRDGIGGLAPDHFDVVIVDEFHHAAARSYEQLLSHLRPTEMLGLTATPERSDGLPVLHWFDDRIAAELRLWDAIDQQVLVPFIYFGIHDGLDLTDVPWRRGTGYDVGALSNLYTSSDAWARLVVQQLAARVDVSAMRCLGFCVSVAHARFMAEHFRRCGIPAVAVSAETPQEERRRALRDLDRGQVKVVFSVDLFNEGVDLPDVDTILMLRPTDSPVLFVQQLGRGLRRTPGKSHCTVLDFVGNHRREFRFDRRLRALVGGTRRDVERAVREKFPYLPAGCSIQLDEVAEEIVLRNLREAVPARWAAKVEELRSLLRERGRVDLATYLAETGLDLEDVYAAGRTWTDLLEAAGADVGTSVRASDVMAPRPPASSQAGPAERELRRAVGRMLHVDDYERIAVYRRLASSPPPQVDRLSERDLRYLHMLVASLTARAVRWETTLQEGVEFVWSHPLVLADLCELLDVLEQRVDHLHTPLRTHPEVPLFVHARYTRVEILAAMGFSQDRAKVPSWQSGVYEAKAAKADLLAFTLDKTRGNFSPTTRYRDYAISPKLIHWESQSTTREDSPTGLRYRNHVSMGHTILLFARRSVDERAFWFLGPAVYRGHVGERPMAVTWELEVPLPGDLYAEFAAAVAR
ncbi:MAG: helicase [Acidimicrobiales bacterium]|nr:MAG: helicase [Acidimicrobiales bacterium]